MKLTVVVVSYNVKGYLSLCLSSALRAMDRLGEGASELWVVDNASSDGSADWVKSHYPSVQVLALQENLGFSKANNLALAQAKGEWVLLLNPDTVVPEDTFERILDHLADAPEVGGLGVPMYDGSGQWLPESKRGMPTPWASFCRLSGLWRLAPRSPRLNSYYFGHVRADESADVEVLSGAFMWMRKKALDEVGLLDESFFMYGEDIDLSIRLINGGWVNRYFSEAPIVHFKGESTKKGSLSYVRVFHDAMRIFSDKHFAGGQALAMRWMIRLGIRLRAVSAFLHGLVQRHSMVVLDVLTAAAAGVAVVELHGLFTGIVHPLLPKAAMVGLGAFSVWWSGRWFGTQDIPFHRLRIAMSGFGAAVSLILLYSLLPETLRVSRLSVSILSVFLVGLPWLLRSFLIASRPRRYMWRQVRSKVVIGAPTSHWNDLQQWVTSSFGNTVEVMPWEPGQGEPGWPPLDTDMVLLSASIGGGACLAAIRSAGGQQLDVRVVPDDFRMALGGARKDGAPTASLAWGMDGLGRSDRRRAKRRLDMAWSLFVLLLGPGRGRNADRFARRNAWQVMRGRNTWVGFHKGWDEADRLPPLPEAIFYAGTGDKALTAREARRLDLRHAADFGWMGDLELLMNLRMD